MYDQIREDTLYIILYSIVTAMNAMASIYLLFRRGNAFAADITPPVRLRRWTAAFFAVLAIGHLWYLPANMLDSREAVMVSLFVGGLLDTMLTIPLALVVMLCMLQDRRRPLWPIGVMVAPLVMGMVVCIITRSEYGRWLRDNFADLEHKEVWQSFLVLAFMMIMFVYYVSGYGDMVYEYIIQVFGLFLIFYLLWRVETLSDLNIPQPQKDDDSSQTVDLYHELAAAHQPITAQQLAHQSGFHSYSTFSAAFKQIMGTTATEWMRAANESA